jgi:predicted ATPase
MIEKLEHIVDDLAAFHNKLVLVVGPPRSGKSALLRALAERRNATPLNIGLTLGKQLLEFPQAQRSLRVSQVLRELAQEYSSANILILDNPEILFDRSLGLDPLALLKQLSKSVRVVAAWPGEIRTGRLTYAMIGHPEYQEYGIDGLTVLPIQ